MPELKLPKPDEVVSALASFPPRLSVLMKPLTVPEDFVEETAKTAGVVLPPGPVKTLVSVLETFETGAAFSLPGKAEEEEKAPILAEETSEKREKVVYSP